MGDQDEFVTAAVVPSLPAARILLARLEEAGIPAGVSGGWVQDPTLTRRFTGLVPAEVRVPRECLESARRLIEDYRTAAIGDVPAGEEAATDTSRPAAPPGLPDEAPSGPGTDVAAPVPLGRGLRCLEFLLVFAIVLGPRFYSMAFDRLAGGDLSAPAGATGIDYSLLWLVMDLSDFAVILLVIGRSGEGWSRFGFLRLRPVADGVGALILILLGIALSAVACRFWLDLFPAAWSDEPAVERGGAALLAWGLAMGASGFVHEVIFRGYFLVRLEQILGSAGCALLVTTLLDAGSNGMSTWPMIGAEAARGAAFGAIVLVTGRIWQVAIAHAIFRVALVAAAELMSEGSIG